MSASHTHYFISTRLHSSTTWWVGTSSHTKWISWFRVVTSCISIGINMKIGSVPTWYQQCSYQVHLVPIRNLICTNSDSQLVPALVPSELVGTESVTKHTKCIWYQEWNYIYANSNSQFLSALVPSEFKLVLSFYQLYFNWYQQENWIGTNLISVAALVPSVFGTSREIWFVPTQILSWYQVPAAYQVHLVPLLMKQNLYQPELSVGTSSSRTKWIF